MDRWTPRRVLQRRKQLLKGQEPPSWSSPLVVAILGASIAGGANVYVSYYNASKAAELERTKLIQSRADARNARQAAYLGELSRLLLKRINTLTVGLVAMDLQLGGGTTRRELDRMSEKYLDDTAKEQRETIALLTQIGAQEPYLHRALLARMAKHNDRIDKAEELLSRKAYGTRDADPVPVRQFRILRAQTGLSLAIAELPQHLYAAQVDGEASRAMCVDEQPQSLTPLTTIPLGMKCFGPDR